MPDPAHRLTMKSECQCRTDVLANLKNADAGLTFLLTSEMPMPEVTFFRRICEHSSNQLFTLTYVSVFKCFHMPKRRTVRHPVRSVPQLGRKPMPEPVWYRNKMNRIGTGLRCQMPEFWCQRRGIGHDADARLLPKTTYIHTWLEFPYFSFNISPHFFRSYQKYFSFLPSSNKK